MDVAGGGAECAQGGELVQVILGARIECLRDDDDADDHAERGAGDECRSGACLEQPVVDAAVTELALGQDLAIFEAVVEIGAHRLEIGIGGEANQRVACLGVGGIQKLARALQRHKHIRQRGERSDSVRDGADADAGIVDLGGVAQLVDAEVGEIGVVGGDSERLGELRDAALLDVPGLQAAMLVIGADDQHRGRAALWLAPSGKADDQILGFRNARRR